MSLSVIGCMYLTSIFYVLNNKLGGKDFDALKIKNRLVLSYYKLTNEQQMLQPVLDYQSSDRLKGAVFQQGPKCKNSKSMA